MIRIFKSLLMAAVGISSLAWLSIILIIISFVKPDPDGNLVEFFANNIISEEDLDEAGFTFSEVSDDLFELVAHMNITLLCFCIFMTLFWSAASHYLNIDAPGKAKIYFLHWSIFTSIYVVAVIGIIYGFTDPYLYENSDRISTGGRLLFFLFGTIYYSLIYYAGVLLGTARFARSSVLFANKLPGNL